MEDAPFQPCRISQNWRGLFRVEHPQGDVALTVLPQIVQLPLKQKPAVVNKPFLMQELLLRISGILRRAYRGQLQRETALRLGERTVDLSDATVSSAGGTVTLTATERAILQKLLDNRGHIVTYDALCEAVWGSDYYGCENSLNVHIRHLREKVEEQPSQPVWILTARGLGYKLAKEGTK